MKRPLSERRAAVFLFETEEELIVCAAIELAELYKNAYVNVKLTGLMLERNGGRQSLSQLR